MTLMVDTTAYRAGLYGELAFHAGRPLSDPGAPAGFGKMIEVDPAGPYAKAGIRNGDFVRTDPTYYYLFRPVVGERVNFTLDRGGVRSEHHIIIAALPEGHEQAHVEKPEALSGHFVAELTRFSGGATASLYTRSAEGHYTCAADDTIDADDPALAAMRAEQGTVVPAELGSPLQAALALPMMHQAALAGFVLLGPKPSGEDYRPDEIEVLGWATQQVGLDLQAIRVRELEQSVLTLEARNANLSDILAKVAVAQT